MTVKNVCLYSLLLCGLCLAADPDQPLSFQEFQQIRRLGTAAKAEQSAGNHEDAADLFLEISALQHTPAQQANYILKAADELLLAQEANRALEQYRILLERYSLYIPHVHVVEQLRKLAENFVKGEGTFLGLVDIQGAIKIYQLIIREAPAIHVTSKDQFRLAELLRELDRQEEAVAIYQNLIKKQLRNWDARAELALLLAELARNSDGDGAKTRAALREAKLVLAYQPNHPKAAELRRLQKNAYELSAKRLLEQAEFYLIPAHRRTAAARRYLHDVIAKYPDAEAAQRAQNLLATHPQLKQLEQQPLTAPQQTATATQKTDAQKANRPKPAFDKPAGTTKTHKPAFAAPVPVSRNAKPAFDKPVTIKQGDKPAFDKPVTIKQGDKPAFEKAQMVKPKAVPAVSQPDPQTKQAKPAFDKPTVVNRNSRPAFDKPTVVNRNSRPAFDKPTVVNRNRRPAFERPTAVSREAKPAFERPTAVSKSRQPAFAKPTVVNRGGKPAFDARGVSQGGSPAFAKPSKYFRLVHGLPEQQKTSRKPAFDTPSELFIRQHGLKKTVPSPSQPALAPRPLKRLQGPALPSRPGLDCPSAPSQATLPTPAFGKPAVRATQGPAFEPEGLNRPVKDSGFAPGVLNQPVKDSGFAPGVLNRPVKHSGFAPSPMNTPLKSSKQH